MEVNENSIIFKGKNNGILVILDDKITFEELKTALEGKVVKAKSFFKGANTSITFKGRKLTDSQETELLDIISSNSDLEISFVHSAEETYKSTKKITKPKIHKTLLPASENITAFHKGSIRSGQSLRFKGSIVIIGDVNPGGEIIAEGNIVVLGSMKGFAHAGCKGSEDCFVSALKLRPTQLRIAGIISYFPDRNTKGKTVPEYAYAKNGEIYVDPLVHL